MGDKLKACPFCGGEAKYVENYTVPSYVRCDLLRGCGVKVYARGIGEETMTAIQAWNRRAK